MPAIPSTRGKVAIAAVPADRIEAVVQRMLAQTMTGHTPDRVVEFTVRYDQAPGPHRYLISTGDLTCPELRRVCQGSVGGNFDVWEQ